MFSEYLVQKTQVTGLTNGAISPIYDEKKLIAAHVIVYKGTDEEYDTFITPEAFCCYEEYLDLRIKFGEKITKNSPVLLRRFSLHPYGMTARIDNSEPVAISTVLPCIFNLEGQPT